MKNQYTKFVKYLEKQENIYMQRAGESVYMTDGKVVLRVPVVWYNNMIRPLSGLLPDLPDDCTAAKHISDVLVTVQPGGMDIRQAVDKLSTGKIVRQSRFLLELPPVGRSKKPVLVRLFKGDDGGDIIGINDVFVDIFAECCAGEPWRSDGRAVSPLVQASDDTTLVMFPIRINPDIFGIWRDLQNENR